MQGQQADGFLAALDHEVSAAAGQNVIVHKALQGGLGLDGRVVPIHRLRHGMSGQRIVERQLLNLSPGGAPKPADEVWALMKLPLNICHTRRR
jgi:hypothetical protein